eukprot:TRINITY_DN12379_c0_g1_i1.p1 TRINITY_DN12379_c0_g1~~TRINITY_DN12379_c0_g1_i1.p1  ORF type:complete len:441 (+),score=125.01 TRINITY_DN12379_c0_g1_i1:153-1325(+)
MTNKSIDRQNIRDWKQLFKDNLKNPIIDRSRLSINFSVGAGPNKLFFGGNFKFNENLNFKVAVGIFGSHFREVKESEIQNEIDIAKKLIHPNIVRLFGYCPQKEVKVVTIEKDNVIENNEEKDEWDISSLKNFDPKLVPSNNVSIVTDLLDTSVLQILKNEKYPTYLTPETCFHITHSVAQAINFLHNNFHSQICVMRHLTPTKIYVSVDKGVVKIGGFSEMIDIPRDVKKRNFINVSNTLNISYVKTDFISPEVHCFHIQDTVEKKTKKIYQKFQIKDYDEKCDIFSFSVIILSLLSYLSTKTLLPFIVLNSQKYKNNLEALLNGERFKLPTGIYPSDPKKVKEEVSSSDHIKTFLCDLMIMCWDKSPQKRPSAIKICELMNEAMKKYF